MKNNRESKQISAKQTLEIIEIKCYQVNNQIINISKEIQNSIENSSLYTENDFDSVLEESDKIIENKKFDTEIIVENCTSMEAFDLTNKSKVGCLNFASANNPGGGFLNGAKAQEESLARASALYPTQQKHFEAMYEYNRGRKTYLYSDRMIFSPQVPFFKDDSDCLLPEPYCMDIVTSPAVNVGAILNNKPQEMDLVKQTMLERLDKVLAIFVKQETENLILGAWGCGVFRNDPKDIADYFAHYFNKGGKYSKAFNKIVFAVYDTSKTQENIQAFRKVFQ